MPSLSDNNVNLDNDALNVCFNPQVPPPLFYHSYGAKENYLSFIKIQIAIFVCNNSGQTECMEILLNVGVDPNKYSKDLSVTPLLFALHQRRHECMEILLRHGADPNQAPNRASMPPLILATKIEDVKAVKLLLKANAKVNKKDYYDRAAIYYAAHDGCKPIVKLLLSAGATGYDEMVKKSRCITAH